MRFIPIIYVLLLAMAFVCQGAPQFITQPSLTKDASNRYWVEFQLSESTNVAVSIVDLRDSTVIRRLAAGVLGSKAPLPLLSNTLTQRFEWDGKDDLGFTVSNPAACAARVRVGMGVELKNLVGDNPEALNVIFGMVKGADGTVYVCGNPSITHNHWSLYYKVIRAFDADGNYLRTLYPFPSNLTVPQVQGWGIISYPAGAYTPQFSASSVPGFSNTPLSTINDPGQSGALVFMDSLGNLVYGSRSRAMVMGTDGSVPATGVTFNFIKSPAFPATPVFMFGPTCITRLPGGHFALASGFHAGLSSSGTSTGWPANSVDSGFYRDGRIFKLDLSTGAASVWLDLDTVITPIATRLTQLLGGGYYSAIHGTAVDSKGRIYVCDRFNRRIGVYDSAAALLGQIPVRGPDQVAVHGVTGAIYVVSRIQTSVQGLDGNIRLLKFASFDAGATPVCSILVQSSVTNKVYTSSLVLTETANGTRIWVGYNIPRIYSDADGQFTLVKTFGASGPGGTQSISRMTVDRRTETVYINNDWDGFYKIENWLNPAMIRCSTSANAILKATDMVVSPHGQLYIREGGYHGPITRYTLDHKHVPINWTNTGRNMLTADIRSRGEGAGYGERGFDVNANGEVAVMGQGIFGGNIFHISLYADSGSNVAGHGDVKIGPIVSQCGGVQFDLKGNLYIGARIASPDHARPAVFATDWMYNNTVGPIIKYPAGFDTGSVTASAAPGSSKIYGIGNAPYSSENSSGRCNCRSPRFDVDPYGRIFAPNAITCEVSVTDNEGNPMLKFGAYGNADSRGGLAGPGPAISTPSIPFSFPVSVAATEDFIYVADMGNQRIARVQMNYALDNHPEIKGSAAVQVANGRALPLAMNARPNPFNPSGVVAFSLSSAMRIRLDVFTPNGRFVRTLASDFLKPGTHKVAWDGTDRFGRMVANGAYYLRLRAGTQELHRQVTIIR